MVGDPTLATSAWGIKLQGTPMTEHLLCLALMDLQDSLDRFTDLPKNDYDDALWRARHHIREAMHQIRLFARVNGIEAT